MKNWWNIRRLQPPVPSITSIRWSGKSSKSRRTTTAVNASLSSNTSDDFPASHHFTRWLSQQNTHGSIMLDHNYWQHYYVSNTGYQDKELDEGNHHQCLSSYKFKAQATQQLMGELPPSWIQRRGHTTGREYAEPSHYNWEAAVTSTKHHLRRTLGSHTATNKELLHYLLRYKPV